MTKILHTHSIDDGLKTRVGLHQMLVPGAKARANYKLAVSAQVAGNSYSSMFVPEAGVEVGGTTSAVRSVPFAREQEEMIET